MKAKLDQYSDKDFPGNAKCLVKNWSENENVLRKSEIGRWKEVEWIRANDIACFSKNRETGTIF